jgi:hypothetical protein
MTLNSSYLELFQNQARGSDERHSGGTSDRRLWPHGDRRGSGPLKVVADTKAPASTLRINTESCRERETQDPRARSTNFRHRRPRSGSTPHDNRRASRRATPIIFISNHTPEHERDVLATSADSLQPPRPHPPLASSPPKKRVVVAPHDNTGRLPPPISDVNSRLRGVREEIDYLPPIVVPQAEIETDARPSHAAGPDRAW